MRVPEARFHTYKFQKLPPPLEPGIVGESTGLPERFKEEGFTPKIEEAQKPEAALPPIFFQLEGLI